MLMPNISFLHKLCPILIVLGFSSAFGKRRYQVLWIEDIKKDNASSELLSSLYGAENFLPALTEDQIIL